MMRTSRSLLVRAYLRYLAATKAPIICGPFRSELGFEVLYWIPFLRWAWAYAGIQPERRIIVTRGGMGYFYHAGQEPVREQVDLYTLRGVDGVRVENQLDLEQRKILKQTTITAWDAQVCEDAATTLGLSSFRMLHPSWMYWLFQDWWEERAPMELVSRHTNIDPLPVPNLPDGLVLPQHFIAVRFYDRHTFQLNTDHTRQLATEMVQRIAATTPVVLLNQQGLFADDHVDLPITGSNIYQLPACAPEHNFTMQAAVLARAQAFVGTYGGVAQWALRYGRPTLCFYTHFQGTALAHRTMSERLSQVLGVPFECSDLRMMKLWHAALNEMAIPAITARVS